MAANAPAGTPVTPKQAVARATEAMLLLNTSVGNELPATITIQTAAPMVTAAPPTACPPEGKGVPYVAFTGTTGVSVPNSIFTKLEIFDNPFDTVPTATSVFAAVTAPPGREEVAGFFATTQATSVRTLLSTRNTTHVTATKTTLTTKKATSEFASVVQLYKDFLSAMSDKIGEIDSKITNKDEFKKIKRGFAFTKITREQYDTVIQLIQGLYADLLIKATAVDKAYFDAKYVPKSDKERSNAGRAAAEKERTLATEAQAKAVGNLEEAKLKGTLALAEAQAAAKAKAASLRGLITKPGLLGDTLAKLFPSANGELKARVRTAIATAATAIRITDDNIDKLITYIGVMGEPARGQLVGDLRTYSERPADIQRILRDLIAKEVAARPTLGSVIAAQLRDSTPEQKRALTERINRELARSLAARPFAVDKNENTLIEWFGRQSPDAKTVIAGTYAGANDDNLYDYINDELRGVDGAQAGGRRRHQTRKGRKPRRRHTTRKA